METIGSVIIPRPQLNIIECHLFTNKGHFSQFGDTEHCKAFFLSNIWPLRNWQVARMLSPSPSLYLSSESFCVVYIHSYGFLIIHLSLSLVVGIAAAPHGHSGPAYGGQGTPRTLVTDHHPHLVLSSSNHLVLPHPLSVYV